MKDMNKRDYKQTEIGEIPEEWEVVKLGSRLTLEYGQGLVEPERIEGSYPVFGSNGIVGYHNKLMIKGPGIVVGRKGTIGAITWSDRDFWPIDTTYYVKLADNKIVLRWLYYKLINLKLSKLNMATGTPGLNRDIVYAIQVSLPPLPEQRKIAEVLSTVDEAIQKVDEAIAKTEWLKKGLMQRLLTKGIGHTKFKFSEELGCEIPEEWAVGKIENYYQIIDCKHRTPEYISNGYPIVLPRDLSSGKLNLDNCMKTSYEDFLDLTEKHLPRKGDIVFCRNASFGVASYVTIDQEFSMGQDMVIITSNQNSTKYLFYLLHSNLMTLQINRFSAGSTFKRIDLKKIRKLPLPLPSPQEQHKIAEVLSRVDEKIDIEKRKRERLERIKKGLMTDLLTGKKRVKLNE